MNLAAASKICECFDVKEESIVEALATFKSLPHRLELVAEIGKVRWYNDSIATTPESTLVALEAFSQPKILIAGGYDKGICFDKLGEQIAKKTKKAILIGQTAPKISECIKKNNGSDKVQIADSLESAVKLARKAAVEGDVVLLSPACASYDMFKNFQHRGNQFAELVRAIDSKL
jgi:UDP-N-acetylmuramoylalanine--D-glutamate ligase